MMSISESIVKDLKSHSPPLPPFPSYLQQQWDKFVFFSKVTEPRTVSCAITLEEVPRVACISCQKGHYVSRGAFQKYVDFECEKDFDEIEKNRGQIKCPACECHYSDQDVALISDPETWKQYQSMKNRYVYQKAFESICQELKEKEFKESQAAELRLMHEAIRNQFKKADGSFTGYSCPECQYGPVDKKACDDLTAHHGQKIGFTQISNACPRCFWFANSINGWKKWDGDFLEGERLESLNKTIADVQCPHEEETIGLRGNVALLRAEMKLLNQKTDTIKHRLLMGAITGRSLPENNNLSMEEKEEMMLKIEDPQEIRLLMNTASAAEIPELGRRLVKALSALKKIGARSKEEQHYFKVSSDLRSLNSELRRKDEEFRVNIRKAVTEWKKV